MPTWVCSKGFWGIRVSGDRQSAFADGKRLKVRPGSRGYHALLPQMHHSQLERLCLPRCLLCTSASRLLSIFSAHGLPILPLFRFDALFHPGFRKYINRMDPLSSLSVASSAIQIFEFSSKLWKQIRELYQSESGATLAQENVLSDAERLCSLNSGLCELLKPVNLQRSPTATEESVVSLCNECDDAAKQLVGAIQKLTLQEPPSVSGLRHSCPLIPVPD